MTALDTKALLEGVTPGPWEVEDTRGRSNNLLRVVAEGRGVVRVNATLYADANARLIASAPRLARRVIELEEALANACRVPPEGWWCSRQAGHDGPCAARPSNPLDELCRQLRSRFDNEPDFLGLEAANELEIVGEALQRVHRYALAAEGVGYDLILSVTDPLITRLAALKGEGE